MRRPYFFTIAIIALLPVLFTRGWWRTEAPPSAGGPQVQVPVAKTFSASSLDVRINLARVFKNTVFLSDVVNPTFVSSDLNGDGAEDLVAVVIANPDNTDLGDNELTNWSVVDVRNGELPSAGTRVYIFHQKHKRISLQKGQPLLAVVHGVGEMGWRSPEAAQAFLLVNTPTRRLVQCEISELTRHGVALPRTTPYPTQALIAGSDSELLAIYWSGAQYAGVPLKQNFTLLAIRK